MIPSAQISSNKTVTIGVDARLSGSRHAGIGRYIENLLLELPQAQKKLQQDNHLTKQVNWVYFFYDRQQAASLQKALENYSNIRFVYTAIRHYSLAEQIKWPLILNKYKLDLLHVPHFNIPLFYKGKLVITIHDLLWHQQIGPQATTLPSWKYYLKYLAYRFVTRRAVNQAEQIFVPAEVVKQTLLEYFPNQKSKIKVIKEGISQKFLNTYQAHLVNPSRAWQQKRSRQLIYVGSLYPHKNIKLILEALKRQPDLTLLIVCSRNVFMKRTQKLVQDLSLQKQVIFTGYLSDQKLIKKIESSQALVQPSKSEGFGLTGVEAMACGTPVLASDIPVFREIYQQAPIYFNPNQVESFLNAYQQLQDASLVKQKIQQGFEVVKDYRWDKMAQTIFEKYQQLV